MSNFIKEDRYLVIKRSDIDLYLREQRDLLYALADFVQKERASSGRGLLKCVVVEDDWPEYEPTWAAIEARLQEFK